ALDPDPKWRAVRRLHLARARPAILPLGSGMSGGFTTRLAPSPTGALPLGHARAPAGAGWWARGARGTMVLRIEALDSPRKKPGAVDALREDLGWLGLDWDRETPIQTSRGARHRAAMRDLIARGALYPCVCSRKDVEEAQSAPHESAGGDLR